MITLTLKKNNCESKGKSKDLINLIYNGIWCNHASDYS